jgi:hypothetical protein
MMMTRSKARLVRAYRVYEENMEKYQEDKSQRWILSNMVDEVENLCGGGFL